MAYVALALLPEPAELERFPGKALDAVFADRQNLFVDRIANGNRDVGITHKAFKIGACGGLAKEKVAVKFLYNNVAFNG